ncbi:hypothetical protein [Streptomyces chartreusis]|uniref:hypothetical protein n=1 Tax=Streptomyces chartreusis TaxID=1969 RepID=UPI003642CD5F
MSQDQQKPPPAGEGASDHPQANGSTAQQPKRIDWMQISAVGAALAAAGGLIFSAWTSYYSVQTAEDQLEQSREDADREVRQQAVLVSVWTQTDGRGAPRGEPGKTVGFITNRSLDPVDQVAVAIGVRTEADLPAGPVGPKSPKTVLFLGPLPPCSRVTISALAVELSLSDGVRVNDYWIVGMSFIDVYGQRWSRLTSGPLQPMKGTSGTSHTASEENVKSLYKALFGTVKGPGMGWTIPGAGNSELDAPKPLNDCGTDK